MLRRKGGVFWRNGGVFLWDGKGVDTGAVAAERAAAERERAGAPRGGAGEEEKTERCGARLRRRFGGVLPRGRDGDGASVETGAASIEGAADAP